MSNATVSGIKLINFTYDFDFQPVEGAEIRYVVDLLHRVDGEPKSLDILVTIKYFATDENNPVLQAACLTSFRVPKVETGIDPTDGHKTVSFEHHILKDLTREAISHARALVAVHTAATPFSSLHVSISEIVTVAEIEREKASVQVNEP
jgi:hypothetical protein